MQLQLLPIVLTTLSILAKAHPTPQVSSISGTTSHSGTGDSGTSNLGTSRAGSIQPGTPGSVSVQTSGGQDGHPVLVRIQSFSGRPATLALTIRVPAVPNLHRVPRQCGNKEGVKTKYSTPRDHFCQLLRKEICAQDPKLSAYALGGSLRFEPCPDSINKKKQSFTTTATATATATQHMASTPAMPTSTSPLATQPPKFVPKNNAGFSLYPAVTMFAQVVGVLVITMAFL